MRQHYRAIALAVIPRIISSIDKNPLSATYGCLDKHYWCYKQTDFPSARFQEAMLSLAFCCTKDFPGNPYYQDTRFREWALAALRFWAKSQHADGSLDEWYPNEKSFCATAFSLYAATETYLLLGLHDAALVKAFLKSARFLFSSEQVANQEIGSITALYNTYLIAKDQRILVAVQAKLAVLKQDAEGWFPEYGGADPGYQTLSIEFLAKYYEKSKDRAVLPVIRRAIGFVSHFIHPDGSIGGIYGSRNTELFFPYGFEIMDAPASRYIAEVCHQRILQNLNPARMDDRYAFPYHTSYLQSIPFSGRKAKQPHFPSRIHFSHAGLVVARTKAYYAAISARKGVYALFSPGRHDDHGYFAKRRGRIITTQGNNQYILSGNTITVSGTCHQVFPFQQLSPLKNIVLRILIHLPLSIKPLLRGKMILSLGKTDIPFTRTFVLGKNAIEIKDSAIGQRLPAKAIYVPTAYF
ncbi:MAG TPA: hypothetical protein VJC16_05095 [Candidatus Nanoarchaeia archaeon]|nr:hypothetical protein [Candidatus Nanoarchaeia archaeon]